MLEVEFIVMYNVGGGRFQVSLLTRSPRLTKFKLIFYEKIMIISDDNYDYTDYAGLYFRILDVHFIIAVVKTALQH